MSLLQVEGKIGAGGNRTRDENDREENMGDQNWMRLAVELDKLKLAHDEISCVEGLLAGALGSDHAITSLVTATKRIIMARILENVHTS